MADYYPLVAQSAVIAAGQTGKVQVTIDKAAGKYTIVRLFAAAFLAEIVGSAPIGTALPKSPEPDSAATPLPTLNEVRYAFKLTQDMQREPLLLSALADTGALMFELPVEMVLSGDDQFFVTFFNDSDKAITVHMDIYGYYQAA